SSGQRKPHPGTSRNGNHGRIGCTGGARPCQKSYLFVTKRVIACSTAPRIGRVSSLRDVCLVHFEGPREPLKPPLRGWSGRGQSPNEIPVARAVNTVS